MIEFCFKVRESTKKDAHEMSFHSDPVPVLSKSLLWGLVTKDPFQQSKDLPLSHLLDAQYLPLAQRCVPSFKRWALRNTGHSHSSDLRQKGRTETPVLWHCWHLVSRYWFKSQLLCFSTQLPGDVPEKIARSPKYIGTGQPCVMPRASFRLLPLACPRPDLS